MLWSSHNQRHSLLKCIKTTICGIIPLILCIFRCFPAVFKIKRHAILSSNWTAWRKFRCTPVRLLGCEGNDLSADVQENYCPWKWLGAILNGYKLITLKGPAEWQHRGISLRDRMSPLGRKKKYSALFYGNINHVNLPKTSSFIQDWAMNARNNQPLCTQMKEDKTSLVSKAERIAFDVQNQHD